MKLLLLLLLLLLLQYLTLGQRAGCWVWLEHKLTLLQIQAELWVVWEQEVFEVQRRSCEELGKRRWREGREHSGLSRSRLVEHREDKRVNVEQVALLSRH